MAPSQDERRKEGCYGAGLCRQGAKMKMSRISVLVAI